MAGFNSTVYIQVASVAGVLAGGFLADYARGKSKGGRQLVQTVGLLGGVPFLFFTGHSIRVGALFVSMTCFGLFKGLYDANIWASLYDFVPIEQGGLATGLMNSLGWVGAGFAPIAVAAAGAHYSLSVCISMTAAIYLILALPMGMLALKRSQTQFKTPARVSA
jgi:sugar phosphate permease